MIEMNLLYLKHTRADHLYRRVVQSVLVLDVDSVSCLQRAFRIGYSRALRLRNCMLAERIIRCDESTGLWVVVMRRHNKVKKYLHYCQLANSENRQAQ